MRIALIYLIFGIIWILFSDALGLRLSHDPHFITTFQNYKGLFFVGLSTWLILSLGKAEARRHIKDAHALRESEDLFRVTFDLTAIGMAHVGPQGNWLRVNKKLCGITGYSAGEMLSGMTFQQITHEEDLDTNLELVQKLLTGEIQTYDMEKRYIRKDGSPIWVHITVSLVRHEDGTPRYFISAVEDVSERRQTSEELAALSATLDYRIWERTAQLAQANDELKSFSYSVSHDLRAPLRAISGFAQILARRYNEALDDQGQHYLNNIIFAAERMNQLVDDLLRYSRLGRQAVHQKPIALEQVLQTVSADLADKIEQTGAQIEIATPLPVVHGDATLLGQIFLNLLDNALKYHRPRVAPRIMITATPQDKTCLVQIADNGQGIPAAQHEKVFNAFQRLHSDEIYPGTGIGLAIVAKAATLSGGHVTLTSPLADGSPGSVFIVCLPMAAEDQTEHEQNLTTL